jgi:hypothetical protein
MGFVACKMAKRGHGEEEILRVLRAFIEPFLGACLPTCPTL